MLGPSSDISVQSSGVFSTSSESRALPSFIFKKLKTIQEAVKSGVKLESSQYVRVLNEPC